MSMEPSREEIKQWLQAILARTGETPSALARRAGLATTTLTRFMNDPDAPMLGLRSIAKIAEAAGAGPVGVPVTGVAPLTVPPPEAAPYHDTGADPVMHNGIAAMIRAQNDLEPWISQSEMLAAAGVLPGDVLLVDPAARPATGDIVRATLTAWQQTEIVFRLYEPPYLLPAALDPRRRKPLLIDQDRVRITGTVRYVLRRA